MGAVLQDLRYAIRTLMARPGFTAVAVLTLALGIGANTTIFTWIKALLLRPLTGVAEQERLMVLINVSPGGDLRSTSYPDYLDYRDKNTVLDGLTAFDMIPLSWRAKDQSERIWGCLVTGNYFDVLGVHAALGRTFQPEESNAPGSAAVAVLSHQFWKERLNGDRAIVGKTLHLNGRDFNVVGVAPPEFAGSFSGLHFDVWIPVTMQMAVMPSEVLERRGNRWMEALARLKPGVDAETAEAGLNVVAHQLADAYPETNAGQSVRLYPMWRSPWGAPQIFRPLLGVLMGVVGLVLLIACANVANLLLARAASRQREIAIRLSVGASRWRVMRQLLTESLLLASLGGAAGLFLALWSSGLLVSFLPPNPFPVRLDLTLGWREFLFALGLTGLTGVIFGMVPAFQATRADVVSALKDDAGSVAGTRRRTRLRSLLVVAQMALSLLLLVCAGLFLRSLSRAHSIDPGFETEKILVASLDLQANGYDQDRGVAFYRQLLDRVETVPAVRSATYARRLPLGFEGRSDTSVQVEGYEPGPTEELQIEYNIVGPRYFETMGIPLRKGRDFTSKDDPASPKVIIVNEAFAARYWPGGDAIGRRVQLGEDWVSVVGVAQNIRHHSLSEEPYPYMYWPLLQRYRTPMSLHVRTDGEPLSVLPAVRQEVEGLDANLPLFDVRAMSQHMRLAFFTQRIGGTLLSVLGLLALGLAAVGVYGVMAYSVNQRTHEIGLRMALGAEASDVLRLVVGQGLRLSLLGVGLGLAGAFALTRLMQSQLIGVSATDPVTFVGVSLILAVIAGLASYLPARRAAGVDPMIALRHE